MKRKILYALFIISAICCFCLLFSACTSNSAKIEQVEGATIKDNQIFMFVSSEISEVSLSDKVKCSKGSTWKLYYDNLGQTEIPTKIATGSYGNLKNGYNEFYIVVNSKDGTITSTYELSIYRSYSIQISYYDGTTLLKSERAYTGVEYTVDYSPNLIGYTFNGWKTSNDKNLTEFILIPWESTNLYVDKTSNEFTATLDVNGGDEIDNNSVTLNYGEETTLTVPTRDHYNFTGWFVGNTALTDDTGKTLSSWNVPVPKIITAHWEIQQFNVTLLKNENEAGTVSGSGTYDYGTRVNLNTNTIVGYNFLGWYDNNDVLLSSNRSYSFTITCDLTLTAKWNYYTLTTTLNDSEAGTATYYSNLKVSTGEEIVLNATTNLGYTWLGWYNGDELLSDELDYYFIMPSKSLCVMAKWELDKRLSNFNYNLTNNSCQITRIIDKTVTEIIVPEYVTRISEGVFSGCSNLESLTLPFVGDGGKIYGYQYPFGYIFGNSYYSNSIKIQQYYYSGVALLETNYYIPSNLNTVIITGGNILSYAFYYCKSISNIIIPQNITSIGDYAFYLCTSLEQFAIPDNVKSIGKYAFHGCANLKSLTIGRAVSEINVNAFYNLTSLEELNFNSYECNDFNRENYIFAYAGKNGKGITVNIGKSVTKVPSYFFCPYNNIEYIPKIAKVNFSEDSICKSIGERSFFHCKNIENISLGTSIVSIGESAFIGCSNLISIELPDSLLYIGKRAFSGCSSLKIVNIPNGIKCIESYTFYNCTNLKNVILSENITSIDTLSFTYCNSLESIVIPSNVTKISSSAFGFTNLSTVFYMGTVDDWSNIDTEGSIVARNRYYYSEIQPTLNENGSDANGHYFWHYVNGEIVIWTK